MIPLPDENCRTYSTKDEALNVHQNSVNPEWLIPGVVAEIDCINQIDKQFTSRTDKPRLAHDVFIQWLTISPPTNNDTITSKPSKPLLLSEKDLLIAAYTGSSIMYRK